MSAVGTLARVFVAVAAPLAILAACGGSSDDVEITVEVGPGGGPGTFDAVGDAICSSGVFTTIGFQLVEGGATFRDQYDCDDGSGSFFIVGEVETASDQISYTGTWEVEDGTGSGDYQDANGSGTLAGVTEPQWIVEYEGDFAGS